MVKENFGKTFRDMANTNIIESGGYGPGFAKLAFKSMWYLPGYNDIRNDNDKNGSMTMVWKIFGVKQLL